MSKTTPKKILVLFGTRPEIIKLAPVIHALDDHRDFESYNLFTGQHRDLGASLIKHFEINVHEDLDLMTDNQRLNAFSGKLLQALDEKLEKIKPDMVLVQGDTVTVAMGSIASFFAKIPVGHVEAGLRTYDVMNPFPEEMNRRLVSHSCALHFCPTEKAKRNLLSENINEESITITGNTVIDALHWTLKKDTKLSIDASFLKTDIKRVLVTAHRRENFGPNLESICKGLVELTKKYEDVCFIYPVHPNPNVKETVYSLLENKERILLTEPLDYPQLAKLLSTCFLTLTDSGGIQEEAPSIGVPVLILRDKTERPEVVDAGNACLVGTTAEKIVTEFGRLYEDKEAYASMKTPSKAYGSGDAAQKTINAIDRYFKSH